MSLDEIEMRWEEKKFYRIESELSYKEVAVATPVQNEGLIKKLKEVYLNAKEGSELEQFRLAHGV